MLICPSFADPLAKDGVVRVPRPPIPRASSKGKGKQALAEDDDDYFEVRLEQIQLEQVSFWS